MDATTAPMVRAEDAMAMQPAAAEAGETVRADLAVEVPAESTTASAADNARAISRAEAAAKLRAVETLPALLRERLAEIVGTRGEFADGGAARIPLDACLRALEESLPDFLLLDRRGAAPRRHPAGEAFFRGTPDGISDADAEAIARQQLANSGLLRGQRARFTED